MVMFMLVTLVILVTLVTLFQSYIQFYRAECITVSGFFFISVLKIKKNNKMHPEHLQIIGRARTHLQTFGQLCCDCVCVSECLYVC